MSDSVRLAMDFTTADRLRLAIWQGKPRQPDSHVDIHLQASINQVGPWVLAARSVRSTPHAPMVVVGVVVVVVGGFFRRTLLLVATSSPVVVVGLTSLCQHPHWARRGGVAATCQLAATASALVELAEMPPEGCCLPQQHNTHTRTLDAYGACMASTHISRIATLSLIPRHRQQLVELLAQSAAKDAELLVLYV